MTSRNVLSISIFINLTRVISTFIPHKKPRRDLLRGFLVIRSGRSRSRISYFGIRISYFGWAVAPFHQKLMR